MQGVARLLLVSTMLGAGGCASSSDAWLRCTLTETRTSGPEDSSAPLTREDADRGFVFVFNPRSDSLRRYEDGQLKELTGLGVFDGTERTGSVVVTPGEITYNYSLIPHSAEFSAVIDRTTLAFRERGFTVHDASSVAGTPGSAWSGSGQCTKIRPQPLRERQI
jgi:hypothetical protein